MATVEGYVTLDTASQSFNISQRQLRRLCQNKELDAIKIGSVWLVRPESVEAYCNSPQRRARDDLNKK
ncbi:MAG: helix-turn-helix domain-containing protein [Gammaproteobacteria bacterium]|nr:helix-turn-helix domain-containing protein [Gammaproteobacteria bacterium]